MTAKRVKAGFHREVSSMAKLLATLAALTAALSIGTGSAIADPPQLLGGLTLNEYCQAQGYDGVVQTKPRLGPEAAIDNWRCVIGATLHPFSMEQACMWQYGIEAVQARFLDRDDAFSWKCFSLSN